MAKNIKWKKVDGKTGISIGITPNYDTDYHRGPVNPNISGLTQGDFEMDDWYYGTCDDEVTIGSAENNNDLWEISDADYIEDIRAKTNDLKETWLHKLYEEEFELRQRVLGTYADSVYASSSGYKYDAAIAFLNNGTPNAGLTTEANVRGISVTALATKIKNNHEEYIHKEAKICGIRGMMYDRISSIGINTSSVDSALASYVGLSTREDLGTGPMGNPVDEEFYSYSSIQSRYDFLA